MKHLVIGNSKSDLYLLKLDVYMFLNFDVTHLCTDKTTGEQFACKTIAKRKLVNKEDIEDVRRDVQIMHHLSGQPNIVELKGAY